VNGTPENGSGSVLQGPRVSYCQCPLDDLPRSCAYIMIEWADGGEVCAGGAAGISARQSIRIAKGRTPTAVGQAGQGIPKGHDRVFYKDQPGPRTVAQRPGHALRSKPFPRDQPAFCDCCLRVRIPDPAWDVRANNETKP
jgi:hypothetical protein